MFRQKTPPPLSSTRGTVKNAATPAHIAIILSFSGQGGVERTALNLLTGLVGQGVAVDLVTIRREGLERRMIPAGVRWIDLGVRHSTWAAPAIARYLRQEKPTVMLVAKDRAFRSAITARRRAGVPVRLIGWIHTNISAALKNEHRIKRWLRYLLMRRLYPEADLIVGVSEGVAEDVRTIVGLPHNKVIAIPNAVVLPTMLESAAAPVDHPWFAAGEPPVILGVGRLSRQKDFPTLIRAFEKVRQQRPCRLMILGDGSDRPLLESLIKELKLDGTVELPGFVENPYAYMSKTSVFVLSSAWEGSGNVLTEALALGTPVVATDCPSGPREMLCHGRYGPLVAVGDVAGMAAAIEHVLTQPLPPQTLMEAAASYTVERSTERFLHILGIKS